MNLTLSQQAKPNDDVLFQVVGGESVLLNLASEKYFSLDPIGTRIWMLLGEDARLQRAFDTLHDEYEVEPSQLEADLLALVAKLADAGLVQVA
jgi:hypothetical protein